MPRHASIFDMVSRERFSCPLRTLETYCWLQLINSESCFPMALRIGAIAGSCLPIAYATSVSPPDEADARPDAAFLQITEHKIGVFVRCAEGGEGGGVKLSFFV